MDNPTGMLWVERYRPRTLEDLALDPEGRSLIQGYLAAGEIPHLLLHGPPGTGKTTVSRMLNRGIDCEVLSKNASKDRGIEIIRDQVTLFVKVKPWGYKWKHVFFDEADGLTPDAQNSLKNLMEEYSDQARFILTANTPSKIIDPIKSRCTSIEFNVTPLKERIQILQKIVSLEGVKHELTTVLGYAEKYTDLRRMIIAAQKSVMANAGELRPVSETLFLGKDLLKAVVAKDWNELVRAAQNPSFDHRRSLSDMFWSVGDLPTIQKPMAWRGALAKAAHEVQWTPDPVVYFLGTVADLIQSL